ncbi:ABC-2 type transporter-domain-containing protein [Thamnocephalis sphaerospora]|uniref:ABC-2 type transporter-domain-containing protein n=1 Tax=Thamnocephalis sphaerospora TaxID=78915 RepID=A0A4P9XJP9_9FUNG|nr:ABC-2 type transporter-domain-containing protein [Thamnocephalis sphaerospora]|eukprot:RKP05994.1 ABC-2 type transporter-domain-containing protein [Thamnocephalis sphaerospora]
MDGQGNDGTAADAQSASPSVADSVDTTSTRVDGAEESAEQASTLSASHSTASRSSSAKPKDKGKGPWFDIGVNDQPGAENGASEGGLVFPDEPAGAAGLYRATSHGESSIAFGEASCVNVQSGKEQYVQLSRTLSAISAQPTPATIEEGIPETGGIDLAALLNDRVDEQRTRGIPEKRLGVSFRDLVVIGDSAGEEHIQTVWSPLLHAGRAVARALHLRRRPPPPKPVEILHGITGLCADGEMLLVLGVPGSGCSTLLRVLANQRRTYREVRGDVAYGGIPADEMAKSYKGEIAYNQEDDIHYPTLTVKNTLEFVAKCRTPSTDIVTNPKLFIQGIVKMVTSVLGLSHCLDTLVGNERVRGVSGGERKRVSIAEQIVTRASVGIWDGSTRGLDASTALDFVRSLRISTDALGRSTIITLYQASESIYELFDKVLVLDQGHCIYFGPASDAKAYFERLGLHCPPRMTTPDFLTGVTQLTKRNVQPGYEDTAPKSAEEFASVYRASSVRQDVIHKLDEYDAQLERERPDIEFRTAIAQERHKGVRKRSPYITPYHHQLVACLVREFHLMSGSMGELISRFVFNAIMAVIVGSVFYKLPLNSSGAFTRGGVIFFALLFNALTSQAELPKTFFGRGVLYKHKALALYHPSAFYISQVLADIPRLAAQSLLFSVLIYWMAGLHSAADSFFTFFFILFVAAMTMTALFRMLGAVSPNVESANVLAGIFLLSFLLYAGYLIPLKSMRPWLIWVRYINPLAWSLEALMINEFKDLTFSCTPPNLLPYGPGYNNLAHQTCTIAGATPGSDTVPGAAYLRAQFSAHTSMLWPNIVITIGFWLLYMAITCVAIEVFEFGKGGYTVNVFKSRPSKPLPSQEMVEAGEGSAQQSTGPRADHHEDSEMSRAELQYVGMEHLKELPIFMWNRVSYTVPFKSDPGGKRQLLKDVTGWVRSGELVALMGSSGAGKTTLLDVLAQRKSVGTVSGDIRLEKQRPGPDFGLLTGYCEQMDVHNAFATVRETIRFSAYLRRPQSVSKIEKDRDVERIIELLELDPIADALIGSPETGWGISIEERKRVTIAMELAAKPTILFLDEPTSGLDAQASLTIVAFLRRLADGGQAIVCTIHQPSAVLFEHFDKLLLLARGGKTVYFGKIGQDARILISYFERNGAPKCPRKANPAEYILDAVGAGVSASVTQDWPTIWQDSPEAHGVKAIANYYSVQCDRDVAAQGDATQRHHGSNAQPYATSYFYQVRTVTSRMLLNYWRMPDYNFGRLVHQITVALILGFTFYRLGHDTDSMMNRSFALFQTTVLGVIIINDVMPQFFTQRALFARENSAGYYSWSVFTTTMVIAELPFIVFNATIFFAINYYLTNYNAASGRAIYFYLTYVSFMVFTASFGLWIAALAPNLGISMLLAPFFTSMMSLFSGVTIPHTAMPAFWRRWIYWIDPYHYAIEGLLTNDLHGVRAYCESDQYTVVEPAKGTCGEYFKDFLSNSFGYVDNPSATSACRYCQYKVGDEFYTGFDWDFSHRWRNFGLVYVDKGKWLQRAR